MLHGILASGGYWDEQKAILQSNYTVITLDLLGFGDSPKPNDSKYGTDEHIASIVHTLDAMHINYPITVVGHSMGAILALSLARRYPKIVKSLLLISLPAYTDEYDARHKIAHSNLVPKLLYNTHTSKLVCKITCAIRPIMSRMIPHFMKDTPKHISIDTVKHTWESYSRSMQNVIEHQQVLEDLAAVEVPTLILIGSKDKLMNSQTMDQFADISPHITLQILAAGHQLPIELPEKTAQIIRSVAELGRA